MDNKIVEVFIPGPAGRLEAKYFKSKKNTIGSFDDYNNNTTCSWHIVYS